MIIMLLLLIDFPSKKRDTYFLYYTIQHIEEKNRFVL